VHGRFGLPHFLEQHVSLWTWWKHCGLRPYLFSPRDNPILKDELMFDTAT
jgi:hypothetical protein